ncbi:RING-H2 finger protein ATL33-like [Punica granatum]|uniref:Uncharacterized protein n=2 Tax=Punica granatum TaxID=22663 RepID=A0A2I0K778_PUNGR|nr:RING-H2 finger protein ATL33-like [Punica granatum]PKI64394.1 hypothetical protein CRG98_015254 [Punica granatum]
MGFPCASIRMPKLLGIIIVLKILRFINLIPSLFFKDPSSIDSPEQEIEPNGSSANEVPAEQQPSASLVPAPVIPSTTSKNLRVVEFGAFLGRLNQEQDGDSPCSICLNAIERSHEIRELSNCTHAFHRECLDSWVGEGHGTCPLCRAMLFTGLQSRDPSAIEGNYYLFGEEYL